MNKFILIAIVLYSCGVTKITTKTSDNTYKKASCLIQKTLDENSHFNYTWLNLKGKTSIRSPKRAIDLNFNIKSRKDSLIWISLRSTFGVEVARVKFNQDSIFIINRLNKTYSKKPIFEIEKTYGINLKFQQIQDIILTEIKAVDTGFLEIETQKEDFQLYSKTRRYILSKNYKIQYAKVFYDDIVVKMVFSEYDLTTGAPQKKSIEVSGREKYQIEINYSKIQFDIPQNTSFNIPKNYEQTQ
jgi:hypothetical protein